ncbi:HlyD family secretion protein [Croceicoccus sp. YJ47]|uniref:HlyD family secretion protein n=1 Tax=Croceicoccus sp. YJ47 TaxID=2798724 RepID=UPI001921A1C7|nr:HlyD family efflux transporter periplasmic adaptor subunit [Croceicoccus sp. YJ47]QQN74647.1 HlyD family efflux transporter periplasmic adaptor subunit [Croceicoccus sp. YJ47]
MPDRPQHSAHFTTLAGMRPPRIARVVALLILGGIALSAAILFFVPWVQTAQGTGEVIALDPDDRVREVTSLIGGRVTEFYVQDGEEVSEGDPIARVEDVDPRLIERLQAERDQLMMEIDAIARRRQVAMLDVDRNRQLFNEGLGSRRDFEQAQIKVAEADATLADARARVQRIDTELSRQSAQIVRAPRNGRVQQINVAAGSELVSQGTVLAVIAPEEIERAVELYINGRDVPLIHDGSPVRLEFEGFPAVQLSGWPSLAQGIYDGQVRSVDPIAQPNGLFRVIVEPVPGKSDWPGRRFVRQGSKVMGWVQGEEVSVGYELWRQLNDFPLEFGPRADAAYGGGAGEGASSGAGGGQAPAK